LLDTSLDLRQTLFDLGSEITDLKGETLRYNAIADELYRTSVLAGAKGDESRQLANSASYLDQLEDSLLILQEEKELLKTGNERVSQLNNFLRQSAFDWLGTNANLTEENMALLRNITWLTQENLDLLNEQNRLSDQIMALDSTLDTYKNLLENHSELNGELNQTTSELASQIYRLELANAEYKRINGELSNSIGELKDQNTELAEQNQILAGLNSDLNNTIIRLDGQVDDLEGQVDDLASQNTLLEEQVDRLEKETDRLGEANDELETNVQDLTSEVDRFVNKTEELQKMNDELENIVSFVNETGTFLDQSMDTVTEYLSEQIVAYRTVATETLKNTFIQRAALWDCAYRDHFGDDDFASDDKIPIPANKFDDVMEYVNDRVLQELCLSLEDFETFLNNKFDDPVFTTDHVISGISSYAYLAFDHYFPSTEVIEGLTEADWALAGYNCNRLPADKLYIHDGKTF
jgi:chromosome segregation ATPase